MKAVKIAVIAALVYVGIVAAFESLIGVLQPTQATTIVLSTVDRDGIAHERVVSRLDVDGRLFVAANHWPRAWYRRALEKPDVQATLDGETRSYRAVPVTGAEHDRIQEAHALPLVIRILTGFPPRRFVRLDPAEATDASR
jgi:hypothetical protein